MFGSTMPDQLLYGRKAPARSARQCLIPLSLLKADARLAGLSMHGYGGVRWNSCQPIA